MSLLQDLLALKQPVAESHDELDAMHAAQADEFHSRIPSVRDMKDEMVANIERRRAMATKELASADEFRVELDADGFVHILDGEETVRLSMPYEVWTQLCDDTMHHPLSKQM